MKALMIGLTTMTLALAAFQPRVAHATDWSNAVDVCQGSLPSFEGALRKRPLGINNEGASTSFVTCSLRAPLGGDSVDSINVLMTNRGAASVTMSCTLVNGVALPFPGYTPTYQPKSIEIAAGSFAILTWNKTNDNSGNSYTIPNLNCALQAGVEINVLQINTSTPAP